MIENPQHRHGATRSDVSRPNERAQETGASIEADDWWGDALDAMLAEIPAEERAKLPKDMSATIDRNLYDVQ